MRFIFTADTHFDSAFTNENSHVRNGELIACFREVVNYAKNEDIGAIVLGGDLFDTPYPSAEAKAAVRGIIASAKEIQFIGISGNHDPLFTTDFYNDLPENFYLFPEVITKFEFDGVTFYGISEKDFDENADRWKGFSAEGRFITLSHGNMFPATLADTGASLCLLGHIHKTEVKRLASGANAIYSGALAGRGFDEAGQKGFYVIDSDDMSYEFINSSAKIYREYDVDITGTCSPAELIEILQQTEVGTNEIARARLCGKIKEPYTIDCKKLCGIASQFCEIKDCSELDLDVTQNINENTLEGEFLRILSAKLNGADDVTRNKLMDAMKEGVIALRRK